MKIIKNDNGANKVRILKAENVLLSIYADTTFNVCLKNRSINLKLKQCELILYDCNYMYKEKLKSAIKIDQKNSCFRNFLSSQMTEKKFNFVDLQCLLQNCFLRSCYVDLYS